MPGEDDDGSGRGGFLRIILKAIWGIPAGVIIALVAGYIGYQRIKGGSGDEPNNA